MKFALYEDPHTHRFAFLPLPPGLGEDEPIPIAASLRWFGSREEAVMALPDLFDHSEQETDQPEPETGTDGSERPH